MSNMVMKNCRKCGKMTMHTQPSTSHILHLLMSIITAGLWIIIWVIVAMSNSTSAQCTECGKTKGMFG